MLYSTKRQLEQALHEAQEELDEQVDVPITKQRLTLSDRSLRCLLCLRSGGQLILPNFSSRQTWRRHNSRIHDCGPAWYGHATGLSAHFEAEPGRVGAG